MIRALREGLLQAGICCSRQVHTAMLSASEPTVALWVAYLMKFIVECTGIQQDQDAESSFFQLNCVNPMIFIGFTIHSVYRSHAPLKRSILWDKPSSVNELRTFASKILFVFMVKHRTCTTCVTPGAGRGIIDKLVCTY